MTYFSATHPTITFVPGPCGTALTTGTMNWMTSGRKRVQRSQKIKELRAKHFAKVAADRARALPHPSRSTSNSTTNGPRQSTDVSRLKSRWVQASQPGPHTIAATVQRPPSGSTSTNLAEDMTPPRSPLNALRGGPQEGSFQPGMLNLDVTPPLGAVPRVFRVDISSVGKASPLGSDIAQEAGIFAGSFQQELRPAPAPPLRPEATLGCPPHPAYLERRQLVFGRGCDDYEGQHSREDYEGQPLGSEGEPQGNPMRFFNSGVEIAHDGSPVPEMLPTSSQSVGVAMAQLLSPSDPDLSASDVGVVGLKGSVGGRGLPRFSKGPMLGDAQGQSVATPSRSWERDNFQGAHHEDFLSSATDLEPGVPINSIGTTNAREHDQTGCWSFEEEAEFEALARTWGLFRGALDSTPGSTTDNSADPSTNKKPSPAYHSETLGARYTKGHGGVRDGGGGDDDSGGGDGGDVGGIHTRKKVCGSVTDGPDILGAQAPHAYDSESLGARKEEGRGKIRDGIAIYTPERECESVADGTRIPQANKTYHSNPLGSRKEEGRGAVRDDSDIYTPKRVCENVGDGTDMLQANNSHAYDSPPCSHRPSGSRREYENDCSRSPELVMLWDAGRPLDEDQAQQATPAIQPQKLQGRNQLWNPMLLRRNEPTTTSPATSTSPSPVTNLALESEILQDEQALQEDQVVANEVQRPDSPPIVPVAAVEGAYGLDKQTSDHDGALPALEMTQALVEGDDTETPPPTAGGGPRKEAQQPHAKSGNRALSPARASDSSQTKVRKLELSPACPFGSPGGGGEDKGQEVAGRKLSSSSERQISVESDGDCIPAKELVGNACPTASVQTSSVLECRATPETFVSDASEEHGSPRDKSTLDSSVGDIDKPPRSRHLSSTCVEGIEKPRQARHVPSMDGNISQSETRKRARETVEGESEQKCDHTQENRKETSARVTGRNGKCRRRQSLTAARRKVDGRCRVGTRRGRTMASTRGYDDSMEVKEGLKSDESSTVTWYRTIVACLTTESRQ